MSFMAGVDELDEPRSAEGIALPRSMQGSK